MRFLLPTVAVFIAGQLASLAEPAPVKPEDLGYKLVWSDEFEGPSLDAAKWNTNYPPKVHPLGCNGEQQAYAPEQAKLRDGKLALTVERRTVEKMPFASGMVASHDKFSQRYGWFEARMKLPPGKGLWPAFWLLPQSKQWPPEIDIMEHKGRLANHVWLTVHERQPNTLGAQIHREGMDRSRFHRGLPHLRRRLAARWDQVVRRRHRASSMERPGGFRPDVRHPQSRHWRPLGRQCRCDDPAAVGHGNRLRPRLSAPRVGRAICGETHSASVRNGVTIV